MIQINTNHLHRFKKNRIEYLYMVSRGIYLAFDIDSLEYKGIETLRILRNPQLYAKFRRR